MGRWIGDPEWFEERRGNERQGDRVSEGKSHPLWGLEGRLCPLGEPRVRQSKMTQGYFKKRVKIKEILATKDRKALGSRVQAVAPPLGLIRARPAAAFGPWELEPLFSCRWLPSQRFCTESRCFCTLLPGA